MKEDYNIVGILEESEVSYQETKLEEIKRIFSVLQLDTFYYPFLDNLSIFLPNYENWMSIPMEVVFKTLNSTGFLESVPLFCNSRETHLNIKLISTAFILIK